MTKFQIKKITEQSQLRKEVEQIMEHSFPTNERLSLEPFFSEKISTAEIFVLTEAHREDVIGFYTSLRKAPYSYLFYIAVDPNKRGNGAGSRLVEDFLSKSHNHTAFLDCEAVYPGCTNLQMRQARLDFYARRGFHPVGGMKTWRGEKFLTLVHGNSTLTEKEIENFWAYFDKLWEGEAVATVPEERN